MGRGTLSWRITGKYLLLGLSCFLTAWVALRFADQATATLPFWPPAGIALYGVVRLGLRSAWVVALSLFAAIMLRGVDILPSAIIAVANAGAAALTAAWVIRRLPRRSPPAGLRRFGEFLAVMAAGSAIAALSGVAGACFWLPAAGWGPLLRVGIGGFLGHFAGALVVAQALHAWLRPRRLGGRPMPMLARLHLAAILLVVTLLSIPVFLEPAPLALRTWHLYPVLIWAALAFRARGASAAVLIASVAAVAGVMAGVGPFSPAQRGTWEAILLAQQFIIITSLIIAMLAEVADERRSLGPLRAARQRFDFALDAAGMVGWEYNGANGRIRPFGDVEAFYGRPVLTGHDLAGAIHPDDRDTTLAAAAKAMRSGEPDYDFEYRVVLPDGSIRNVLARGRAVTRPGEPTTLSGIAIDVTARRRDEERQALLMAELDHRVKNILATIQALISRTATDKTSVPELAETLKGRVQAMARAHSMLARNRWEGASLRGLLDDELKPYGDERVALLGPDIQLSPRAALSLSLVLHELATNAAKYGGLSRPEGRVAIGWAIEAKGPTLVLDWIERGGPPVAGAPARRGFGTVMTGRVVQQEFGGRLDTDYAPEGLSFRMALPLARVGQAGLSPARAAPTRVEPKPAPVALAGRRILVVEDAPIIAEATERQLRAAGVAVMGPFGSVASALAGIEATKPEAALLDVNLGEEMVFPLAERLEALGVPFAFATGYGDDTVIPPGFRTRPRLLKPFDEAGLLATLGPLITR